MLVVRVGFNLVVCLFIPTEGLSGAVSWLGIVADLDRDPLGGESGAMCKLCGDVTLGLSTEMFESAIGIGSEVVVLIEDAGLAVEDEGPVVVVVGEDGLWWWCRSTWPRSRVGSTMLRTSCLRCLTSVSGRTS